MLQPLGEKRRTKYETDRKDMDVNPLLMQYLISVFSLSVPEWESQNTSLRPSDKSPTKKNTAPAIKKKKKKKQRLKLHGC